MSKPAHLRGRVLALFTVFALVSAGCSGSSSDAQDEIAIRPTASFAVTNALSQQLFAEAVTLSPISAARLPVAGTATYRGAVSYVDSNLSDIPDDLTFPDYETFIINNPDYVSRIRLRANFGSDTIEGSLDSFRNTNNEPLFIDVDLTGQIGTSSSDTAAFVGTLTGTNELQTGPGEFETKNFTGGFAGNFLGDQGETVLGTLGIDKGLTGDQRGAVFGVFTAEQ